MKSKKVSIYQQITMMIIRIMIKITMMIKIMIMIKVILRMIKMRRIDN